MGSRACQLRFDAPLLVVKAVTTSPVLDLVSLPVFRVVWEVSGLVQVVCVGMALERCAIRRREGTRAARVACLRDEIDDGYQALCG